MCGIAGFSKGFARDIENIHAMLRVMHSRGPDAQGVFDGPLLALGHNRLAIQDVSEAANQPMTAVGDKVVIAFNGEIYNWRELRAELSRHYRFRTARSDTEVILAGYTVYGPEILSRLEGMFALAIYDRRKSTVLLARDRIGEKPLFYTCRQDRDGCRQIAFASEIRGLAQLPSVGMQIDQQSIYHYLTMLSPPPGATMFKGISKLKAGHFIEFDLRGDTAPREQCYWDVAAVLNRVEDIPYETFLDRGEEALAQSISLQSLPDVPLAVSLSGGLDSSLNLHFAARMSREHAEGRPDRLYAINVTRQGHQPADDESVIAEALCKDLDVNLLKVPLSDTMFWDEFESLDATIADTPIAWPDMVLCSAIAGRVRQEAGAKVLLVGEGGDELGAYQDYFGVIDEHAAWERDPASLPELRYSLMDEGRLVPRRMCFGFYEVNKKQFWKGAAPERTTYAIFNDLLDEIDMPGAEGMARKILNLEYNLRLPELLLPRLDYATMAHSVEARAPFLGRTVLENILSTSFAARNHGRQPKAWIYDMARRHLPDYIVDRKKYGFGHEFKALYNGPLKDLFEAEVLANPDAPLFAYVDYDYVANFFERVRDPSLSGTRIWIMYSLNRWLQKF